HPQSPAALGFIECQFRGVDFGNPPHDGKTETAPRFAGAEYSIETLPELRSLVGRDSPPFIGDCDARGSGRPREGDTHRGALRAIANGVVEEIAQKNGDQV